MRPILSDAVPSLTVTIDGRPARFTRTSSASQRITWNGAEASEAALSGVVGGREGDILRFQGTWAIFRLFNRAQWYPGDGFYRLEWNASGLTGVPVRAVFDVNLGSAKPILQPNFFAGVSCSGRVTR
jgi:type VI protein secretion system component VasK